MVEPCNGSADSVILLVFVTTRQMGRRLEMEGAGKQKSVEELPRLINEGTRVDAQKCYHQLTKLFSSRD